MPTILIADDSVAIQRVVQVSCSVPDVSVIVADNYPAALAKLAAHKLDLVIADVELPGIPSLEDLQKLTSGGQIPLVLLLSSYSQISKENLQDIGFQDFLQKPFDSKDLLQIVANNLQLDIGDAFRTDDQAFPMADDKQVETTGKDRQPAASVVGTKNSELLSRLSLFPTANKSSLPTKEDTPDGVEQNLSALVKKAVFEYCQNNFSQIAREAVLSEIRRLQSEKSNQVANDEGS